MKLVELKLTIPNLSPIPLNGLDLLRRRNELARRWRNTHRVSPVPLQLLKKAFPHLSSIRV